MDPKVEFAGIPQEEQAAKFRLQGYRKTLESEWEDSTRFSKNPKFLENKLAFIIESYHNGSSASHAIQCAASRVGDAGMMLGVLADIKASETVDDPRGKLIGEMEDVLNFQMRLNDLLSDLLIADLLSYKEQYDLSLPEDRRFALGEFFVKKSRGTFPIVSAELARLKPVLEDIDPDLRRRVGGLTGIQDRERRLLDWFGELGESRVGEVVQGAIDANDNGDERGLDDGMNSVIKHFAAGAGVLEINLSRKWNGRIEAGV